MAWKRRYPMRSFWREFDEMMGEMEDRLQSMFPESTGLLPSRVSSRFLPAIKGEFRIDVREHEDDVIVVADLPGVEKEGVTIRLLDPATLLISVKRMGEKEEEEEGYYLRERVYGTMRRTVTLPFDVTDEGATASFKNGVLEVQLKKIVAERGTEISID